MLPLQLPLQEVMVDTSKYLDGSRALRAQYLDLKISVCSSLLASSLMVLGSLAPEPTKGSNYSWCFGDVAAI